MHADLVLWLIAFFALGFFVGMLLYILLYTIKPAVKKKVKEKKTVGNLRIDYSDPDGPLLFLELVVPVLELAGASYALFKVVNKSYVDPQD